MKIKSKMFLCLTLIFLFTIPFFSDLLSAQSKKIGIKEEPNAIFISTEYLTMKISEIKPNFIWWNGNQSSADEMYNVQFKTIQEFFGNDEILDSKNELNGISYNLLTSIWTYAIIEDNNSATVILTLSGLANNAEIQFIAHIYSENKVLNGTDQTIEALSEVKFDIIVKNWHFSSGARGLALKAQILESQNRHRVQLRNGTNEENGNCTRKMQFQSEEHGNKIVAYFEWINFADIYDGELKVSSIEVGNTFLNEDGQGQGPGTPGMVHLWLTYPNYGDALIMKHDPSIGVYPDAFLVPLYILPIIGGFFVISAIIIIIKKRK